jgi:surface-anchored protein
MTAKRFRRRPGLERLEDRTVPATLSNFLTSSHTDLNLSFVAGSVEPWSIEPRDADSGVAYRADDAVLYVGAAALAVRPASSEFDFLGVGSGASFYQLPQNQNPETLFLGVAGQGASPADFDRYNPAAESGGRVSGLGRWLKVTLVDVDHFTPAGTPGTGKFSVWLSGDTGPSKFMATSDGIAASDALWSVAGGHVDYNWGFSQKGRYEVTVKLSGYLNDGNTTSLGEYVESDPMTLYFSVRSVGQLEFDAPTYTVNEGGGAATVTVRRVNGSDGRISVQYAAGDGSATAGSDYAATSGTLTFDDQQTSKMITIPIIDDAAVEGVETINLTLSNPGPLDLAEYLVTSQGDAHGLLGAQATATLSIGDNDATTNTPPTISAIADQSTSANTPKEVAFTVGDAQTDPTALQVSAASSNVTLVPSGNFTYGGSGAARTVTVAPAADQTGSATITITVTDAGGLTATATFVLTVSAANSPPTITNIPDQSTDEDIAKLVTFTVGDIETPPANLTVTATSSNQALVANANLVVAASGAERTLTITPAPDRSGAATITVTVKDAGGAETQKTFAVTVRPVGDSPTAFDDTFAVSPGNVLRANVLANDQNVDSDPLAAALLAPPNHGVLTLGPNGSFVYAPGPTFAGSDTFTYTAANVAGTDTATVTVTAASDPDIEAVIGPSHADIGVNFEDGQWDLHVHIHDADLEYEPGHAVYDVARGALVNRPAGTEFDFLGAAAGASIYRLTQTINPELLFLGLAAEELQPGTFEEGHARVTLRAVDGPGHFSAWKSTDAGPDVLFATSDGVTDVDFSDILEGGHSDMNWAFTAPGRYAVTLEAKGTLIGANAPTSAAATYYFAVDANLATTTTLGATPNATTGGSLVTFTASVAPPEAAGTVAFVDGGTPIAGGEAIALVNGVAVFQYSLFTAGTHTITAHYSGSSGYAGSVSSPVTVVITAAPPQLAGVELNGHLLDFVGNQHSRVVGVVVAFNQPVELDAGALSLGLHTNDVFYAGLARPSGFGVLPASLTLDTADNTRWTVTFAGNTETGPDGLSSLQDGVYDLKIDASKVHPLGVPGLSMAANFTTTFHRLFGDTGAPATPPGGTPNVDFEAVVNTGDNLVFRGAFNNSANYKAFLDFNGDGAINSGDNLQFRNRFNKSLTWRA